MSLGNTWASLTHFISHLLQGSCKLLAPSLLPAATAWYSSESCALKSRALVGNVMRNVMISDKEGYTGWSDCLPDVLKLFRLRICILHLHSHFREVSALTIENTKAATDMTWQMNKIVSLYWNGTEVQWTSPNFAYLFSGPWYNNCSHLIHCKAVDWVFVPTQGRSYFKIKFTFSILMLLVEKHTYSLKTGILIHFDSWK